MIVLGIETSCDETAVAIVKDGKEILSNVVFTQIDIHKEFGGVVPEVASRHHVQKITYVFDEAIRKSGIEIKDIDLIAVTHHPGLVGSLLVGINAAYAFGLAHHIDVIEVDHIHGHIYANYLEHDFTFPLLALVVSGGHTELVLMKDHMNFEFLGETKDDAVGEAYDKVGRVMGLKYPGGAMVDKLSFEGTPSYNLPLVYLDKNSYDFSFSGLKSAVINIINKAAMKGEEINRNDLCASFQNSVVKVLVDKTVHAAKENGAKMVLIAGGVAANLGLRTGLENAVKSLNDVKLIYPSMKYCTDNAAMIASCGYFMKKSF